MKAINILLLDDHQIFLDGIGQLLSQIQEVKIVLKTSNSEVAFDFLKTNDVHILLTDLSMPNEDGNSFIGRLKKEQIPCKVIVLSMHMDEATVKKTIDQNVDGYLFKDSDFKQLKEAIIAVADGKKYFDSRVSDLLLTCSENDKSKTKENPLESLTEREKEILSLLVMEYTQIEIGEKLHISASTVVYHKRKLMAQFEVKNASGLIRLAVENGIFL